MHFFPFQLDVLDRLRGTWCENAHPIEELWPTILPGGGTATAGGAFVASTSTAAWLRRSPSAPARRRLVVTLVVLLLHGAGFVKGRAPKRDNDALLIVEERPGAALDFFFTEIPGFRRL